MMFPNRQCSAVENINFSSKQIQSYNAAAATFSSIIFLEQWVSLTGKVKKTLLKFISVFYSHMKEAVLFLF